MKRYKVDKRKGEWIRIRHPLYSGKSAADVHEWVSAMQSLQIHNPELYAMVMHRHLIDDPIKYRKEWLNLKYPPVQPEPEPEIK
jgi:hypothetical protein